MSRSATVRAPAVAGQFYPADPGDLLQSVRALIAPFQPGPAAPVAVISPHAGYAFSGKLTAQALVASAPATPDVIAILSPSHRHAFDGIAVPSQSRFAIPGTEIPVARTLQDLLIQKDLVKVNDAAHAQEHGIEVQLPILHEIHPGVPILPLVIGRAEAKDVGTVVDQIADTARAPLFVLSSDLSHYLSDAEAKVRDAATARRIETAQTDLEGQDACGARAISGYFHSRFSTGNRLLRMAMTNSGAVTGDLNRTVGYGAWSIAPAQAECVSQGLRAQLLRLARQVLISRVNRGNPPHISTDTFPMALQTIGACFVTLEQKGRLRGCIGSLRAHRPLVEDVAVNVQKSAFEDPRFHPFRKDELPHTTIKIALLSAPRPMAFANQQDLEDQLVPGRDGLILRDKGRASTFLPMVWDKLPDPHAFMQALKTKAGLAPDHWSDTLTMELFHAETFAEPETQTG